MSATIQVKEQNLVQLREIDQNFYFYFAFAFFLFVWA